MVLRDEEHPEPRRAPRRDFAPASVREKRTAGGEGERSDTRSFAVELHFFSRPEPAQQTDAFFDHPTPAAPFDAEHVELFGAVPDADHVRDAAAAQQVDDREVFGELHRLVQRQQQRGDADRHGRRASRERGRERHGRREVAVVDRVVFRDDRGEATLGFGPRGHVERRVVHRRPRVRVRGLGPHAEAHHEHVSPKGRGRPYAA